MITPTDVQREAARRITSAYPYWTQLSALLDGDEGLISGIRGYRDAVARQYRALVAMQPVPLNFSADKWWPPVVAEVVPPALRQAAEPAPAVLVPFTPAPQPDHSGALRQLAEACNDLAAKVLRQGQELAEAREEVAVLAGVLARAKAYSVDGKAVQIELPPRQIDVINRAIARAA